VSTTATPRPRATLGNRRRVTIAVIVVLAALGALLYQGLSNAATYFYTADQAVSHKAAQGTRRFRIEGTVLAPVRTVNTSVEFQIENNNVTVDVVHTGNQPQLFKPGIPVVLEGRWSGNYFASDLIMIKHTATYRQQNPSRVTDYPS
jgi:cytochrome c-type biogenesis protein CcmE